ncbi:MAG TPA: hypothetical protein DCZ95_19080 [Verrucomicrobia bacterium]|nr:MAG: hypothetical protein A2X46_13580 [Lentisphaerae bacterium GWF2_57_35]HBA86190.1 hypothetical protein [Verrucomicrobiota bacterium]
MKKVCMGQVEIGMKPRIIGCVTSVRTAQRIQKRKDLPFDVAEFRADLMGMDKLGDGTLCCEVEKSGRPVLLTVRSKREGGAWAGTGRELIDFYRRLLPQVSAIDAEIRSKTFSDVVQAARGLGKTAVASFHDFERTPSLSRLKEMVKEGRKGGAHIVKVAAMIRKPSDAITLYELLREASAGPLCVIGMGPAGLATRIGLPCAGSCLAYGFIDAIAAPGQLSCRDLKAFFRRFYV